MYVCEKIIIGGNIQIESHLPGHFKMLINLFMQYILSLSHFSYSYRPIFEAMKNIIFKVHSLGPSSLPVSFYPGLIVSRVCYQCFPDSPLPLQLEFLFTS